ncbi:MAG: hypothetical protein K2Z81_28865, partial [Cyanobacteria bacterium]|nr:hypothetical protein [Cyanobacteriota bacterium]
MSGGVPGDWRDRLKHLDGSFESAEGDQSNDESEELDWHEGTDSPPGGQDPPALPMRFGQPTGSSANWNSLESQNALPAEASIESRQSIYENIMRSSVERPPTGEMQYPANMDRGYDSQRMQQAEQNSQVADWQTQDAVFGELFGFEAVPPSGFPTPSPRPTPNPSQKPTPTQNPSQNPNLDRPRPQPTADLSSSDGWSIAQSAKLSQERDDLSSADILSQIQDGMSDNDWQIADSKPSGWTSQQSGWANPQTVWSNQQSPESPAPEGFLGQSQPSAPPGRSSMNRPENFSNQPPAPPPQPPRALATNEIRAHLRGGGAQNEDTHSSQGQGRVSPGGTKPPHPGAFNNQSTQAGRQSVESSASAAPAQARPIAASREVLQLAVPDFGGGIDSGPLPEDVHEDFSRPLDYTVPDHQEPVPARYREPENQTNDQWLSVSEVETGRTNPFSQRSPAQDEEATQDFDEPEHDDRDEEEEEERTARSPSRSRRTTSSVPVRTTKLDSIQKLLDSIDLDEVPARQLKRKRLAQIGMAVAFVAILLYIVASALGWREVAYFTRLSLLAVPVCLVVGFNEVFMKLAHSRPGISKKVFGMFTLGNTNAIRNLALLHVNTGDFLKAEKVTAKAIKTIDPKRRPRDYMTLFAFLAQLRGHMGKQKEAEHMIGEILEGAEAQYKDRPTDAAGSMLALVLNHAANICELS